jgi:hypothetical protein
VVVFPLKKRGKQASACGGCLASGVTGALIERYPPAPAALAPLQGKSSERFDAYD